MAYNHPRLLTAHDDVSPFVCRSPEQTKWLRSYGKQSVAANTSKVFVVTEEGKVQVVAYYAWCMASIAQIDAPARLLTGAGRYPQPVALLARLGVDESHEGRGLGAGLVADVVRRFLAVSQSIGCRGLLIHAADDDALSFYRHLLPDIDESPTNPRHLVLLTKDAATTFRS